MLTTRFYIRLFVVLFVLATTGLSMLSVLWGSQRPGSAIIQSSSPMAKASETDPDTEAKTPHVILRSNPPNATVFEGNRKIGTTPLHLRLTCGKPRLFRLIKRGYKDRIVVLDSNRFPLAPEKKHPNTKTAAPETELVAELIAESSSTLVITSEPAGAEVFIGGIRSGVTPFTRQELRPGKYTVRVAKNDYFTEEKEILLDPGKKEHAHLVLQNKTEALYRDLIALHPTSLCNYSELIHYYLLKGDLDSAITVMNEGLAAIQKPNAVESGHYMDELVHSYSRYYDYPPDIDDALLRKTVRDIFTRIQTTNSYNPKRLQTLLRQLDNHDRNHPLPQQKE